MTFVLDHAPSKYVQIEQSTDTFTAFSHVQYPGSDNTLYTVFLRLSDIDAVRTLPPQRCIVSLVLMAVPVFLMAVPVRWNAEVVFSPTFLTVSLSL